MEGELPLEADRPTREEVIQVADRTLPLREWEGEVLVRAAGWIAVVRGTGLTVALLACACAYARTDHRLAALTLSAALAPATFAFCGVGLLRRFALCRLPVLLGTMLWVVIVLRDLPPLVFLGRNFELAALRAKPLFLGVLPAFVLVDVFALFAVFHPDGERALRLEKSPLPRVLGALRSHPTGRVLVSAGMAGLAALSALLIALSAPALVVAQ